MQAIHENVGISYEDIAAFCAAKELTLRDGASQQLVSIFELAKLLCTTPEELKRFIAFKQNDATSTSLISSHNTDNYVDNSNCIGLTVKAPDLKQQLNQFKYNDKPKVLTGLKGMSVKANRKVKIIQLRDFKNSGYFELMRFSIDHVFTEEDEATLQKAHQRFRSRLQAGACWRDKNFLLNETYREIKTFRDLLNYYAEGQCDKTKVKRMTERYFAGRFGDAIISNYCAESFRIDYLDRTVPTRQPSDRNEVIKIINAAISKAKADMKVKIDVQQLVRKGERSRADNTDKVPPTLSTLAAFLKESYDLGETQLVLSLITQLMVSTRKTRTNLLQWHRVNIDECYVEVPSHESKTTFVRHPFPARFRDILLSLYSTQQSACKDSQPNWLFESKTHANRPARTLDKEFNQVRANLLNKAKATGASEKELNAIRAFTQHRIRDIVQKLVLKVGATLSQKEKCLGRQPDDVGYAYDELSIEALCELKDKMIEHIEAEQPELKALFQRLIDKRIC